MTEEKRRLLYHDAPSERAHQGGVGFCRSAADFEYQLVKGRKGFKFVVRYPQEGAALYDFLLQSLTHELLGD